MMYETIEEAIVAAQEILCSLDTVVKITKEDNGMFALFGNGEVVKVIE